MRKNNLIKALLLFCIGVGGLLTTSMFSINKADAVSDEYVNLVSVNDVGHTFDVSFTVKPQTDATEKIISTMYFWATFNKEVPNYVDGYSLVIESMPLYNFYNLKIYE